ncbi:sensor histidine kinase [Amycolatopsis cihanbeyliensis]|uniref:Signal transduction histidine kinase n=1 Tax=Amycolatopsis cihanbeyliensis TaxID=1128664 RepID=A0A542DBW5_AMYCI|nr:histidine kinase [Amycolatopsis cihanbeyliensis]TQJ00553.1 signal transduction histidine kinase [Amycolatopsis cihanbeyliensis]
MSRFSRAVSATRRAWRVARTGGRSFPLAVAGIVAFVLAGVLIPGAATIAGYSGHALAAIGYTTLLVLQLLICLYGLVLRVAGMTLRQTWPLLLASAVVACVLMIEFHHLLFPLGNISMFGVLLLILITNPWCWVAYLGTELLALAVLWLWAPPAPASLDTATTVQNCVIYLVGGIAMRSMTWLAVHAAQLAEAKAEIAWLTVTQERDRISQDLHDRLGQDLVSIMMRTELAGRLATTDPGRAERESRAAHLVARRASQEMRGIAHGTLVADLDAELAAAVELLESRGAACRLRIGEYPDGPAADVLAWVLRESVTNILRHSEPTICTLELVQTGDRFEFLIENDGVTGRGDAAPGRGLAGIAERVRRIGGTCGTEVTDGQFRLTATLAAGPADTG